MAMLKFSLAILITMWVAVVATNSAKAEDPSPAPSPVVAAVDCPSLMYNIADCVSFFSVGSNDTKPSYLCCLGLKEVLYTDAECICEELKSNVDLGIEIDIPKATTLPSACDFSAPSISNCDIAYPPSGNPPPENTTALPVPLPSLANEAPAPANSERILNPAPAPSSGDSAPTYSSAQCFRLIIMLLSFML